MSYFGYPTDLLRHLAGECEATARVHDTDVQQAMIYLSDRLNELAPLYEALCSYGIDDDADDANVVLAFRALVSKQTEGR